MKRLHLETHIRGFLNFKTHPYGRRHVPVALPMEVTTPRFLILIGIEELIFHLGIRGSRRPEKNLWGGKSKNLQTRGQNVYPNIFIAFCNYNYCQFLKVEEVIDPSYPPLATPRYRAKNKLDLETRAKIYDL